MNNLGNQNDKLSLFTTVTDYPLTSGISDTLEDDVHSLDNIMEVHREFVRAIETDETQLTDQRDVVHEAHLVNLLNRWNRELPYHIITSACFG